MLFLTSFEAVSQVTSTTYTATSTPKTLDSEIARLSLKYGVSEVLARKIMKCESEMYFGAINENKRNGVVWSVDMHDWQINDFYHKEPMRNLGLDYYDRWDSLEYGFILLKEQGTKPWSASKHCWNPKGES